MNIIETSNEQELFDNIANYGVYSELVQNQMMTIYTKDINKENFRDHFNWLLNIFRDGIELDYVHRMKVNVVFEDNESVVLSIFEYFMNVMFWSAPLSAGDKLTTRFFFWTENFTASSIKEYIDDNFLDIHRSNMDNRTLNVTIDDTLELFKANNEFAIYYMNTINNEDTIKLMNSDPEFYRATHTDFSVFPLDDVKAKGEEMNRIAIEHIMNSDHCLGDAFRAEESINKKQFREYMINKGTVVNGDGSIFPTIINASFANKGLDNITSYYLESQQGRLAQITNKEYVGTSGALARKLSLNNRDTFLNQDPLYSCHTKNLVKVFIANEKVLNMYKGRYYRFKKNGVEYRLSSNPTRDNKELVGLTIFVRSPMTCESNVFGYGICHKCYGDLYYTNIDINIGQMAAELLSSRLTQMLLSAKHLLESRVIKPVFPDIFYLYFAIDNNIIRFKDSLDNPDKCFIMFETESIYTDEDSSEFKNYCTGFNIILPDGSVNYISLESGDDLFLLDKLSNSINEKHQREDGYYISFSEVIDDDLFLFNMGNNDLSQSLEMVKTVIDKEDSIKNITLDQFIEKLVNVIIESGIRIDAVHLEVILSNQIRKFIEEKEDILERPDWGIPNVKYSLITLNKALNANPSITTTLEYQNFKKNIIDPLTYKKTKPSGNDLIFMEKPQEFTKMRPVKSKIKSDIEEERPYNPMIIVDSKKKRNK